jgi:hypothetical protein
MTGASSDPKNTWHEGWLSAQKDNSTGSVMVEEPLLFFAGSRRFCRGWSWHS